MKALLPVAGSGTRMYPLGVTTPKCLIQILNKPLIVWSLEALAQNGINEVVVVVSAGKFGKMIQDFLHNDLAQYPSMADVKIEIAIQEQQLGTAHVVQAAKDHFQPGEQFIFLYGDDLYGPGNVAQVVKHDGLSVTGQKVSDPEKWGIFQADADGNLIKVWEKSTELVGDLANIGMMKLDTRVFDLFDQLKVSPRGEYELTDSLQLLAQIEKVRVFATVDYWIPIGYPWHILEAAEYFLPKIESKVEGEVEENVTIEGKLILPKSSKILAGTYISGNVMVGENVIIGPDAFLRQNVVIGDNSRIGFAVQIKNSVIGHETKVANHNNIADSVIGNNVNFSSHSATANWRHDEAAVQTPVKGQMVSTGRRKFGSVIGDNVRLGINTVIYPGRKIWPNQTTKPGDIVDKDLDKDSVV